MPPALARRTLIATLALAFACTGSPTPASVDPTVGVTSPNPSGGIPVWAAGYQRYGRFTGEEAVAQAGRFDLIGARPPTYRGHVAEMRAANPDLVLLAYMNATFAQKAQSHAYPSSWYLRDASGRKVRSTYWGNYLMDPLNPGWIADRVATCGRLLQESGYDGCLLDVLGTAPVQPGYVTDIPVHPGMGTPWNELDWLHATSSLAGAVKAANPAAIVIGNGLGNGTRFSDPAAPTSLMLSGIDGGVAESWLRWAGQPVTTYPSVRMWVKSVDMLGSTTARILVMTKLWIAGTSERKDAWRTFALASFLLGNDGSAYFSYSASRSIDPLHADPLVADEGIGTPVSPYALADGVYQRAFTNGRVLVNPSAGTFTVDLAGNYTLPSGDVIRSLTLGPYGAAILTAA